MLEVGREYMMNEVKDTKKRSNDMNADAAEQELVGYKIQDESSGFKADYFAFPFLSLCVRAVDRRIIEGGGGGVNVFVDKKNDR